MACDWQKKGYMGFCFGEKRAIIYSMHLLHVIWCFYGKYARGGGTNSYWRKYNILPPILNINININVGSETGELLVYCYIFLFTYG